MEALCLRCSARDVFTVLGPFERKGYEVVGLKSRGGASLIALRASPAAVQAGRTLATKLLPTLPAGASLVASQTMAEALEWLHEWLGGPTQQTSREVVQWEPDDDQWWLRDRGDEQILGSHNGNCERFTLGELLAPGAVGSSVGARFCHQMRRDSYVPIVVTAADRQLLSDVEEGAVEWFLLPEEDKEQQGGAYGHVDRKFTGYRSGKFREQLEVRQTLDKHRDGIYPLPSSPDGFGESLHRLMGFLDTTARGLLRHIAVDVGAEDGFFEGLLDPPPASLAPISSSAANGAANGEGPPPCLGHSLLRLCKYDPEDEGVYGSNVLCEAHNDVGFITLDACASVAGLETLCRADGLWVPIEESPKPTDGTLVLIAMVGDTLGRLTANYYAPCKHRVVQPPSGVERIGLPFLFRGRSDAVLNTKPTREACKRSGRVAHLAEMESTTIKELPAFDSAKSILRGWFRSVKKDDD